MTPPFAAPARGIPETDQCHRRADIWLRRGERKIHLCHCGIFVCFETIDNINCYKVARARLDKEGGEVYFFRNFHIHFKCLTFTKNINCILWRSTGEESCPNAATSFLSCLAAPTSRRWSTSRKMMRRWRRRRGPSGPGLLRMKSLSRKM